MLVAMFFARASVDQEPAEKALARLRQTWALQLRCIVTHFVFLPDSCAASKAWQFFRPELEVTARA